MSKKIEMALAVKLGGLEDRIEVLLREVGALQRARDSRDTLWSKRVTALEWAKEVGKGGTPEATLELAAKVLAFLEADDG